VLKPGRLALALMVFAGLPVVASNLTGDAPMAHFKGKDQALYDAALKAVLESDADGTARSWSNPETKASGEVKSIKSFTRGETRCRAVSISNKAQGRTSSGDFNFCRSTTGKWTLAS